MRIILVGSCTGSQKHIYIYIYQLVQTMFLRKQIQHHRGSRYFGHVESCLPVAEVLQKLEIVFPCCMRCIFQVPVEHGSAKGFFGNPSAMGKQILPTRNVGP